MEQNNKYKFRSFELSLVISIFVAVLLIYTLFILFILYFGDELNIFSWVFFTITFAIVPAYIVISVFKSMLIWIEMDDCDIREHHLFGKNLKVFCWDEIKDAGLGANPMGNGPMHRAIYVSKRKVRESEKLRIYQLKKEDGTIVFPYKKDAFEVVESFFQRKNQSIEDHGKYE